ncbi:MAG: acyl-CoA dehydrogenase family protein [Acidimicrobiales bacterium]
MDFDESPEEEAFRLEVRRFLEEHASRKTGTTADWSRGAMADNEEMERVFLERSRQWQRTLYDNGWAGITWPKEFGGRGCTPAEAIIFGQEAAAFDVSPGFFGTALSLVGPALMRHGSPAQQERYLRPLLRGDETWCQLFSEPGAGSDLAALSTRAVRDGDELVVNGQKVWNSQAQHADFGILIVRTDPDAPKHRGITFLILDMHSPGVDVRPLREATGQAFFNEVFLDDVRVPIDQVLGGIDEGWAVTRTVLTSETGMIGSGRGAASFEALQRMAVEVGRTDDPLIRQRLADVYARERMQDFLGMRMQTFVMHGRGHPPDPSVLKNFNTASNEVKADLGLALQRAGGMLAREDAAEAGLWQNFVVSQFASRIGGGTNEVHRNMIAERALGLPREVQVDKDLPWRDTVKA